MPLDLTRIRTTIIQSHYPPTPLTILKVTRKEGTLELVSYDEKVVMKCQNNALHQRNATFDDSSSSLTANTTWNGTEESCSTTVPVGVYYNDVWEYDLNCTRQASEFPRARARFFVCIYWDLRVDVFPHPLLRSQEFYVTTRVGNRPRERRSGPALE